MNAVRDLLRITARQWFGPVVVPRGTGTELVPLPLRIESRDVHERDSAASKSVDRIGSDRRRFARIAVVAAAGAAGYGFALADGRRPASREGRDLPGARAAGSERND
jgi:hypothetical protein